MEKTTLKKLSMYEEAFCREYVKCMVGSEAYRKVYSSKNKPKTIWESASKLLARSEIKAKVAELKADIEETLGLNKVTEVQKLIDMRADALSSGSKDLNVAVSATKEIMKAMGYYAPIKQDVQVTSLKDLLDELKK